MSSIDQFKGVSKITNFSYFLIFEHIDKQMAGAGFGGPLLICLLNLTLNEKSSLHSLQFVSKYHVSLDSLWPQIWEHTYRNLVTAAIYYTRIELEKM